MQAIVRPDGTIEFLYSDIHKKLIESATEVKNPRVSDVEPTQDGKAWVADMSRVGGPELGPFPTRDEALRREVEWLEAHGLPDPVRIGPDAQRLVNRQTKYIADAGGLFEIHEADDSLNDLSRKIVQAVYDHVHKVLDTPYVGRFNGKPTDRTTWPYDPEKTLCNFAADFVLPGISLEVDGAIRAYRQAEFPGGTSTALEIASAAVIKAGGVHLHWS